MKTNKYTSFPFLHFVLWATILLSIFVVPRTPEPQIPTEFTSDVNFNQFLWRDYYYEMQRYEQETEAYKVLFPIAIIMAVITGILVIYDWNVEKVKRGV